MGREMTVESVVSVIVLVAVGGLGVFVCVVFACAGISLMGRSQR
jgi:hypothetical protein